MKFLEALKNRKAEGKIPLITDIKCFSPKDGDLMRGRDPVKTALQLEQAGACAISVVTEEKEFHGSMTMLKQICDVVSVPVLRKDFITCAADLDETKAAGADAILLMVSCLGEEKLTELYYEAIRKGLIPFVETHTPAELEFARRLRAPLIGINNRNILELERDDGTVAHASSMLKDLQTVKDPDTIKGLDTEDTFYVVESAMQNGEDVRSAMNSGADAVLVGTAVLNAPDPGIQYKRLTRKCGVKICGLMSEADVDAALAGPADICGFVVRYPVPVRWNLDREQAGKLIEYAKSEMSGYSENTRPMTCVVTGGNVQGTLALAQDLKPDIIQLHYRETLEETRFIAQHLKEQGIKVIRSIPGNSQERIGMFGTDRLPEIVSALCETDVYGILFDSRDAGNASEGGGSIMDMDGDEMPEIHKQMEAAGKMLLVGGGIIAQNCAEVMGRFRPDYLDIMTGAEGTDGKKSGERIRQITDKLN